MPTQDYYETLGVDRDASPEQIKKAFYKLAQKYHPDAGGDEEMFKQVNEAYEVLSDPEKKAQYDRFGAVGDYAGQQAGGWQGNPFAGGSPFGGGSYRSTPYGRTYTYTSGTGNVGGFNWNDVFNSMRNGDGAFGTNWDFNVNRAQKGRDLQTKVDLTFDEAFNGTTKRVSIRIPSTGETQTLTIKVPAGAVDGGKLRYHEKGEYGANGGKRGDLLIITGIKEHPVFKRDGADVLMDLPVSIDEAVLGTSVVVPTPDGSCVRVRVPAGTQDGRLLRVRGKGAKKVKGSGTGDLKIKVVVKVPPTVNEAQKRAIEEFRDASPDPTTLRQALSAQVAKTQA